MIVIETFAGDSAPAVTLNLVREDGTVPNITGATVALIIYDPDTNLVTNNPHNLCVVTNGSSGQCTYTWNSAGTDCPDPGIYKARLKIWYAGGGKETTAVIISAGDPIGLIS